jgi:hypothetical protein
MIRVLFEYIQYLYQQKYFQLLFLTIVITPIDFFLHFYNSIL